MLSSLDAQIQAALIEAVAVVVAAIAGFGGLILQLRSQTRQSTESIAEILVDAVIAFDGYLRTMQFLLAVAARAHAAGLGFQRPSARFLQIIKLHGELVDAAYRFIFLVENSRIIDPRMIVFRTAMNAALHDIGQAFQNEFHLHIMPALPVEAPDGNLYPYTPPSIAASDQVQKLCDKVGSALTDITSYTEDFAVEIQNHLLGDLFKTKVSHRVPIDPNSQVITLQRAGELEAWFMANTNWGHHVAEVEARTRAAFN
jgi:hypothetical protein